MSAKTWIKDSGGMYTVTPTRGARAGETVYKARVWIKSRQDFAHFYLGVTLKQAQRKMREILGDPEAALLARNERPAPPAPTFDALVKAFLAGYKSRGESGYYGHVAESWKAHFGTVPADSITRAMVEDYRDTLRRDGYGDSTIRKYVGALGTCYRWAMGRGVLTANPVLDVRRPSEPDREVTVLSRDDESKFLAVTDDEARRAIRVMLESGMRQGETEEATEAFTLRWGQVVDGNILVHKSKTGKGRAIPINKRLGAALDDCLANLRSDILRRDIKAGKAPAAFVLSDPDGKPLNPDILWRRIESAMESAGIAKVKGTRYNLYRHTFGSRLAEAGVSMATIATIMGNSEAVCMRHYIKFSPGHLRAAMATLDAVTVPPTAPPAVGDGRDRSEGNSQVVAM